MTTRYGSHFVTFSGQKFYPFDPQPEEIHIQDIAHHLSLICRFGGSCSWFYSVAEHSLWVSKLCPPPDRLWGLLHDAAEAYLGDVIRPIKCRPEFAAYRDAKAALLSAIIQKFGLAPEMPASVYNADELMLGVEDYNLNGRISEDADVDADYCRNFSLGVTFSVVEAERAFLARFKELNTK